MSESAFEIAMTDKLTNSSILEFQSAHPYADNTDDTFEVHIPGAKAISICFSDLTCTEANYDNISFFKVLDENNTLNFGSFSGGRGGSQKRFPGVGSQPPLVINHDKFSVKFVSDGNFYVNCAACFKKLLFHLLLLMTCRQQQRLGLSFPSFAV